MESKLHVHVSWGKPFRALLLAAVMLPMAVGAGSRSTAMAPQSGPHIQPALLTIALQQPDATVSVIVQKTVQGKALEDAVGRLGGRVTKDLHIINAFSAEMPARSVQALANSAGVRWVSLDAPVHKTACSQCISTDNLLSPYVQSVGATQLWNTAPNYLQGQGVGVAVVDSGIARHDDFASDPQGHGGSRIIAEAAFNSNSNGRSDRYGHGTTVAGIIAGNGAKSEGAYIGVAPKANLINVKVSDDEGASTASDVVEGLQWVNDNRARYNIRVANISLNSSVPESYHTSAIDAAVEILWFNRIVVVVSAGNKGPAGLYPPANDPFVITVGAADDKGTPSIADDSVPGFSAFGVTSDGIAKPDLVAPGTNMVSDLASIGSTLSRSHSDHRVTGFHGSRDYFRVSGTSMAAPVVSGAVALLLQDEPGLTPDQVKYRLMETAVNDPLAWSGYNPLKSGAGYLDIYAAVNADTTLSANTGTPASRLLWTGEEPLTWGSVNWNSVNWNSVNWNSVNWNSVNWNSVNWSSTYWEP